MLGKEKPLLLDVLQVAEKTFITIFKGRIKKSDLIHQLYEFANRSLGIVVLCVTFTGVILFLEYSYHIKMILGDDSLIPTFAMIMLTRELAPAIAALLIVSKMGAGIAAELGAMKTSEQLDAYRLLGLNPIEMFIAPQMIASSISTFLLSSLALLCALIGGGIACVTLLDFTPDTFLANLLSFTRTSDFVLGAVKALLFGASIPVISGTIGMRCKFGSEGVGIATTDAVVASSIWIIILDFILTYLFSLAVN